MVRPPTAPIIRRHVQPQPHPLALPVMQPVRNAHPGGEVIVSDLIKDGACSPPCLLAVTSTYTCRCTCNGSLHGLLTTACVDSLLDARRAGLHLISDADLIEGTA